MFEHVCMCACIRSIHVYMRVRLCSGMYSDVVVAVCCYYGGFFLYISLYSLGFLRYNFFFFVSCVCVSFDGTCVNEMSGLIVFFLFR